MTWMISLQLLTLASMGVIGSLVRAYLPSYLKEKGKNLATKEDIGKITKEIESVKTHYAGELELLKQSLRAEETERSRQMNLRREVYFEAAEGLGQMQDLISAIQRQDIPLSQVMDTTRGLAGSLNKFQLIASDETLEALLRFSDFMLSQVVELLKLRVRLEATQFDIDWIDGQVTGLNAEQKNAVAALTVIPREHSNFGHVFERYQDTDIALNEARDKLLARQEDKTSAIRELSLKTMSASLEASLAAARVFIAIRREIELPLDEKRFLELTASNTKTAQTKLTQAFSEFEAILEKEDSESES